jgi:hypothetical protein
MIANKNIGGYNEQVIRIIFRYTITRNSKGPGWFSHNDICTTSLNKTNECTANGSSAKRHVPITGDTTHKYVVLPEQCSFRVHYR